MNAHLRNETHTRGSADISPCKHIGYKTNVNTCSRVLAICIGGGSAPHRYRVKTADTYLRVMDYVSIQNVIHTANKN